MSDRMLEENSIRALVMNSSAFDHFQECLPDEIIDVHVHTWPSYVISDEAPEILKEGYSYSEYCSSIRPFFPKKEFASLLLPYIKVNNHKAMNDWIFNEARSSSVKCQIIPDLLNGHIVHQIEPWINNEEVSGFKTYPYQVPGVNEYQNLFLYVPKELLEIADEKHLNWTIHLPRRPQEYIDQICEILSTYPNVRINLAHAMRFRDDLDELKRSVNKLFQCNTCNLFIDLSTVYDINIINFLMNNCLDNLIWGTDAPFCFSRHLRLPQSNQSGRTDVFSTKKPGIHYNIGGIYYGGREANTNLNLVLEKIFKVNPLSYIGKES